MVKAWWQFELWQWLVEWSVRVQCEQRRFELELELWRVANLLTNSLKIQSLKSLPLGKN